MDETKAEIAKAEKPYITDMQSKITIARSTLLAIMDMNPSPSIYDACVLALDQMGVKPYHRKGEGGGLW